MQLALAGLNTCALRDHKKAARAGTCKCSQTWIRTAYVKGNDVQQMYTDITCSLFTARELFSE